MERTWQSLFRNWLYCAEFTKEAPRFALWKPFADPLRFADVCRGKHIRYMKSKWANFGMGDEAAAANFFLADDIGVSMEANAAETSLIVPFSDYVKLEHNAVSSSALPSMDFLKTETIRSFSAGIEVKKDLQSTNNRRVGAVERDEVDDINSFLKAQILQQGIRWEEKHWRRQTHCIEWEKEGREEREKK